MLVIEFNLNISPSLFDQAFNNKCLSVLASVWNYTFLLTLKLDFVILAVNWERNLQLPLKYSSYRGVTGLAQASLLIYLFNSKEIH